MMQVQVMEFTYDGSNVSEIESQMNSYLAHHDVQQVKITQHDKQLLVFFFEEGQ